MAVKYSLVCGIALVSLGCAPRPYAKSYEVEQEQLILNGLREIVLDEAKSKGRVMPSWNAGDLPRWVNHTTFENSVVRSGPAWEVFTSSAYEYSIPQGLQGKPLDEIKSDDLIIIVVSRSKSSTYEGITMGGNLRKPASKQ